MQNRLYNDKALIEAIDILIKQKVKNTIPRWYKSLDFILAAIFLIGYMAIIVIVLKAIL